MRLVKDALEQLPERMRETVVLFDIGDLSLEEIRAIQGGTVSGVKSRLKRGRELLAKILEVDCPIQHEDLNTNERVQSVRVTG